ncbi:hypothetical protein [Bythopirellula polymerisocia]|uniref:hypothetical protein n=1 Tax=Bythopirellula polymerisocia TaxID=2528003 RepID=UPI0011B7B9CB|nr:hypothetical protein [Bythopirellula polymerisocia]
MSLIIVAGCTLDSSCRGPYSEKLAEMAFVVRVGVAFPVAQGDLRLVESLLWELVVSFRVRNI